VAWAAERPGLGPHGSAALPQLLPRIDMCRVGSQPRVRRPPWVGSVGTACTAARATHCACPTTPTAAGRAPGRMEAVHRAKTAFTTSFPAPWRPPQVSTGFIWALPVLLFPLVPEERGRAAPRGPAGGRIRVDDCQVHREIPPPIPRPQQDISRPSAITSDVHFKVVRDPGLGEDLAEERLGSKVPVSKARFPARHGVVAENVHRPPAQVARSARAVRW